MLQVHRHIRTIGAALHCLPPAAVSANPRRVKLDETSSNPPLPKRVPDDVTKVLDALAAICVLEPDTAYAAAFKSPGLLLVASNSVTGVPSDVLDHLRLVFELLWQAHGHAAHPADVGNPPRLTFVPILYSSAWSVLRHRCATLLDTITQSLQNALESATGQREAPSARATSISALRSIQTIIRCLSVIRYSVLVVDYHANAALDVHTASLAICEILESESITVLLEHMCEFDDSACNVLADLHSVTWLARPTEFLSQFPTRPSFSAVFPGPNPFVVVAVPPVLTPTPRDLDFEHLSERCREIQAEPSMDAPRPNFAADVEVMLLQPMQRLYPTPGPDDGTPSSDPGTLVAVHAECVLLAIIDAPDRYPYVHYIATSEPSCLLCFRLFEAWRRSNCLLRGVYLRGSTGRVPSTWATPDLFSVYQYQLLLPELWCDFAAAMEVMYQRRQGERQRERIARGEKPETPEERAYRKKARIARQFASIPMYERLGRMLLRLEDYEKLQQDPDSD